MMQLMLVVHVLICLFIIAIVLLQATQQANMGGMFGGGASQTVFGSGTQTALGKATTIAAVLFFSTCLMISFMVEKNRSVIKREETVFQKEIEGQTAPKEEAGSPAGGAAVPEAGKQPLAPEPAQPGQ